MRDEDYQIDPKLHESELYNEDLAPVPPSKRSWNIWSLAALWVGMAVCIPTYMLASSFIIEGISWQWSLLIIGLANVIITVPMILTGHAGVKFGVPFPVIGRSAFGHAGIHFPAIIRGIIAAGWFGIQTWIGGISIYSIFCAIAGQPMASEYGLGHFTGFGIFWLINVFFIYKGTESIKWLEIFSAPILLLMGVALIIWGSLKVGGFNQVLDNSYQLQSPNAQVIQTGKEMEITFSPLKDQTGKVKAKEFQLILPLKDQAKKEYTTNWALLPATPVALEKLVDQSSTARIDLNAIAEGNKQVGVKFRSPKKDGYIESGIFPAAKPLKANKSGLLWSYIIMLTAMVGFWATMSISIADITRFVKTQKDQIGGQFIGLPATMILYSFVGIFVTIAAAVSFDDILNRESAPWDPSTLLSKFKDPVIVVIAQLFMLIATLSTNIAANVIAPANAFSNAFPRKISFRSGGLITAVIGILIFPWVLINHIVAILLFVSSLLGPVLAILICDYYLIHRKNINLNDLFNSQGKYNFGGNGINTRAFLAMFAGILVAGIGYFYKPLAFLYDISWFSGFFVSFIIYWLLEKKNALRKTT